MIYREWRKPIFPNPTPRGMTIEIRDVHTENFITVNSEEYRLETSNCPWRPTIETLKKLEAES